MRMDNFLRSTDVVFQTAEAPQQGDRFVRKMATYGQVRPSVSFTSESRAVRPFVGANVMDMSSLPAPMLDPKGDPREGTLEYAEPSPIIDSSFVKMLNNHSLMLPSERLKEAKMIKAGKAKFEEDRDNLFRYRKRLQVLERHYPNGISGIDGPTYTDTKLYAQRREQLVAAEHFHGAHAAGRHDALAKPRQTSEALTNDDPCKPHNLKRSEDLCIQRKSINEERHPYRFLNTHDRLFPSYTPSWDPVRASMQRSHDVRDKQHCIISGQDNSLSYKVAPKWDDNIPQKTIYFGSDGQALAEGSSRSTPHL
jgi:hypothetical protein